MMTASHPLDEVQAQEQGNQIIEGDVGIRHTPGDAGKEFFLLSHTSSFLIPFDRRRKLTQPAQQFHCFLGGLTID